MKNNEILNKIEAELGFSSSRASYTSPNDIKYVKGSKDWFLRHILEEMQYSQNSSTLVRGMKDSDIDSIFFIYSRNVMNLVQYPWLGKFVNTIVELGFEYIGISIYSGFRGILKSLREFGFKPCDYWVSGNVLLLKRES